MNPKDKRKPRQLSVVSAETLTPNYRRITLGGDDLAGFPADQTGGYIKLIFNSDTDQSPTLRTYTIRNTRIAKREIDVDFVIHGDGGPASDWAAGAKAGDSMLIAGPGPKSLVNKNADWFLLAGDMTAFPAICVNLEQLPPDARGYVVVEAASDSDIQPIEKPAGMAVKWIVNPQAGQNPDLLVDTVKELPWLDGEPGIWSACEFKAMKKLRTYFMKERKIERKKFYISSYWKHGVAEDEHKVLKKADQEKLGRIQN